MPSSTSPSSPRTLLSSSHHSHSIPMPSTSPTAGPVAVGPHALGSSSRVTASHLSPSEQRERQRQQDIDSAIGFTRARSASISFSPPLSPVNLSSAAGSSSYSQSHSPEVLRRPSAPPRLSHHSSSRHHDDTPNFPMLSEAEEAHMSLARNGGRGPGGEGFGTDDEEAIIMEDDDEDDDDQTHAYTTARATGRRSPAYSTGSRHSDELATARSYEDVVAGPLRASPGLLGTLNGDSSRAGSVRRLDLGGFSARNRFQFDLLEEFAQVEKVRLGTGELTPRFDAPPPPPPVQQPTQEPQRVPGSWDGSREEAQLIDTRTSVDVARTSTADDADARSVAGTSTSHVVGATTTPLSTTDDPTTAQSSPRQRSNFVRQRQRKLSQSNPAPNARRQAKVALFEDSAGPGTAASSFPFNKPSSHAPATTTAPALPNNANFRDSKSSLYDTFAAPPPPGLQQPLMPYPSDLASRPYRFSFYSNALPSTIHARSLSELPGEGQSFEDLFSGRSAEEDSADSLTRDDGSPKVHDAQAARSGTATPRSYDGSVGGTPTGTAKESLLSKAIGMQKMAAGGAAGGGAPTPAQVQASIDKAQGGGSSQDPEATTWWLDVLCPTDEEMKTLSKVFGIHPLTTEDIQMEEAREKIELFRNYYLVCFRSFDQDPYSPTHLEPLNMYIIVFREGTLSFHFRGTPHPQNVRRRIKQLKDYISVTSDWISYALIDDISDAFGPLVQSIEYEVDSIDELVLILKEAEQSDMLRRIGTCRKKVMGLLRLMGNKADVVKGLAKRCNESWSVAPKSDIGLYLSDIQDHLITMTQNLNHYEKILSRSHSNYLAQISIDMTEANNQMNEVLSRMTALGTVLIPMNLVTGLWGMNVHVPGESANGLGWFFGIVGCLIAFAVIGAFATYRFLKL